MRGRILRQARRFSSYAPPGAGGGSDNSAAITLLGLGALVGGVAYVYYDPDVLPAPVKKFLPIQEPKGHGMSLEEYEKWRAQQAGGYVSKDAQSKKNEEAAPSDADDVAPPSLTDDLPVPRGDVPREEMIVSIEKLLAEARENEAAFLADFKKSRKPLTEEDRQMAQAYKEEKARLKKELKFVKSSK